MTNDVKRAMDANLASMQVTEMDARRLTAQICTEPRPRPQRMFPRGVMLAALIVLLLASAVILRLTMTHPQNSDLSVPAAQSGEAGADGSNATELGNDMPMGLGVKEIIEKYAVPMAAATADVNYTQQETQYLADLAAANGLTLSNIMQRSIEKNGYNREGVDKCDLMTAIAEAAWGQYTFTWPQEEQLWFDSQRVASGWQPRLAKPPENGITMEMIMQAALGQMQVYWPEFMKAFNDTSRYAVGMEHVRTNRSGSETLWVVWFHAKTLTDRTFNVCVEANKGTALLKEWDDRGADSGANEGSPWQRIIRRYRELYGSEYDWDQPTLQAFQNIVAKSDAIHSKEVMCMVRTAYALPGENTLPMREAAARAAVQLGMNQYALRSGVLLSDNGAEVWRFWLETDKRCLVEVNSVTGEILTVREDPLAAPMAWYEPLVLQRVLEDVNANWVDIPDSFG